MSYNYLPGFDVSVRDGGLVVPREGFESGSLLIIGPQSVANTAGQLVTPVPVRTQEEFETNFGTTLTANPLFQAWKQATDAGCRDIRLIELCEGNTDKYYANLHKIYTHLEDYYVDAVALVGVYSDSVLTSPELPTGSTFDYVTQVSAIFTEEDDEVLEADGTLKDFTLEHAPVINNSLVITVNDEPLASSAYTFAPLTGVVTFNNAPDEDDVIVVSYRYAPRSLASQLAGICKIMSQRVHQTLGFIATKPASDKDLATIKSYIDAMTTQVYDGLLQVITGPEANFLSIDGTEYEDSGVAAYASQVVMIPAQSSPTNKLVPGARSLVYNLSPAQLDNICSKNMVTFRTKNGAVVVTDAVTTAGSTSDFTRISTMKQLNEAVDAIRTVADPFIGEPQDTPTINALNTAIRSALEALVKASVLTAYRFSINATLQEVISGNMRIDLEIVPKFELRKIRTTVALRPSL